MDLEAPPPMLDDGMYPMPMVGDDGGSQENGAAASSATDPSGGPMQSLYQLAAANDAPPPPAQEPLRVLPPPPPVIPEGPPLSRPTAPHRHPAHAPPYPHPPRPPRPHAIRGHGPALRGLGDDTAESASNLLGLALVAVPVGGYVGGRYAGALGILGGMLAAGGLVNGIRAGKGLVTPPTDPSETWVSATFAVLGLGAAAYLLYRGHGANTKTFQANEESPKKGEYAAAPKRLRL